ncbi:hypothetical protein [Sphaerisporangium aureirubrum]|uniref:Uncharacterized protein n=1 Tax=Sphaerisporangium aureirubrum TaxID=1544736 RepID=A0ABW1NLQ8_9ACTN
MAAVDHRPQHGGHMPFGVSWPELAAIFASIIFAALIIFRIYRIGRKIRQWTHKAKQ